MVEGEICVSHKCEVQRSLKCKLEGFLQDGPLLVTNGVITSTTRFKWNYKWVTGVITPINGVISLLITATSPLCSFETQPFVSCKIVSRPNKILRQMTSKRANLLCTFVCLHSTDFLCK